MQSKTHGLESLGQKDLTRLNLKQLEARDARILDPGQARAPSPLPIQGHHITTPHATQHPNGPSGLSLPYVCTLMRCILIRYTLIRHTPVRCMSMRCISMRGMTMRDTPIRHTPHEMHAHEMYVYRCTPLRHTPMRHTLMR